MSVQVEKKSGSTYKVRLLDSAEFVAQECRHDWLVDSILVAGQPGVIGGEAKALKTTIGIDLAVSLGTGTPFLGTFVVPERRRVAFVSGESGEATLQETARRICAAKGVEIGECDVFWTTRLPDLGRKSHRMGLRRALREREVDVVILDPLYLLLGSVGSAASNLYEVGKVLHQAGRACLAVGATPVFVHHSAKNATKESARALGFGDLAFSGIAEYVRQWLMLSRRVPYQEGSGAHSLHMTVGGSAGHSGRWKVDVHEGVANRRGRRGWDVRVSS